MRDSRFYSPRLSSVLSLCIVIYIYASTAWAQKVEELDRIIAVVNDSVITKAELEQQLLLIKKQLQTNKTQLPPESVFRRQVLERMIVDKIQLQLAQRRGIRVDDETVNRVIGDIAKENKMSLEKFRQVLAKDGVSFAEFRGKIRDNIITDRLKAQIVDSEVTITPQEVDNYLQRAKTKGDQQAEYSLSHILIAIPEAATPEQIDKSKNKAGDILKQLHKGADFAKTAISYSDGEHALKGGRMDWLGAAQLPTLFADAIVKMKPGQISELIRSPNGFHIIRLDKVRSSSKKHVVEQTQVRHILLKTNTVSGDSETRARLEKFRQQIKGGEDFARLAKLHSDDKGSGINGGSMGWTSPGQFVPEFEEVMDKLKPGELSEVFKTRFGWHLVQVTARRKHDDSEAYNRNQIQKLIHQRKANETINNWIRRIRDEAYVEYHLDN